MKKRIYLTLSFLIISFSYSNQTFAHFGPLSKKTINDVGIIWCQHVEALPEGPPILSLVKFEVAPSRTKGVRERYMTNIPGGAYHVVPQILYSNDRIKKKTPNMPIRIIKNHRTPIAAGNRWYMGFHMGEPGEQYKCRIKPFQH